jgi:hypothetical protein
VVKPYYQPPVPVGSLAATPVATLSLTRTSYEPSYEWFIVWSSFFSACLMLYVTVFRGTLWQHACAMFFSSITTAIAITHCFYISQLVTLTAELVASKDALNAVKALYAGLIGWTLMNICAIGWMCLDIDHDIALDEATKNLAVQQEVLRSRAPSRATPAPFMYSAAAAAAAAPGARGMVPRVASADEVDRILEEVLEDGSLATRSGLGRGSGLARGSGGALARAEEGGV